MSTIFIIALLWGIGTCIRAYQQARFYQIEEYMSRRYLRWLLGARQQMLPVRGIAAGFGGILAGLFVGDTRFVTTFVLAVAAIIASYPQPPGEVKKAFVRTPRATRILAAAFLTALLIILVSALLISRTLSGEAALFATYLLGFIVWLAAPLLLPLGKLLTAPIEAFIRNGFKRQARAKLERINPTVIGITGSYGKTSTKHYLAHLLGGKYQVFPTPKSWNTIMGVTRAINEKLPPGTDYFICEMGAYIRGEIEGIAALTRPAISIVTEVGPQHLERFGTVENIATAKYEIIKALPPDGVGVFNADNPHIQQMIARNYPQTRLSVSAQHTPAQAKQHGVRFVASDITETLDGLAFTVTDVETNNSARFNTAVVGQHNVTNILLATAVAIHAGLSLSTIAERVRTLQPAEARLVRNVLPNGMTIINDAYSANPVGAVSSLRVLGMHTDGRRLLITPGMVELGPLQDEENRKLGQAAAPHATDVILVGAQQTRPVQDGLLAAGFPEDRLQVMDTVTEAINWYQQHLGPGDTVLFLNDLPDTY